MKKIVMILLGAAFVAFGALSATAAHHKNPATPHSVIHVVTVSWKADATDDQIKAALDGVKTIAKEYEGCTRVWIRSIKVQGDKSHAFVMEFASEQALKDYAGSAAQKKWYELYLPIRGGSTTFDITN
ncbi:Dabb family protein [Candidatus Pelagisphaera phototrophica]|jgi:hypothetical protein|uniref:Dabb family protein n=1 Tax=Candidatus Pelagisphaera phototrophica TaxID=2684113 RepID=UPI0019E1E571|nr:Dabb family protein [Candidatus Pelagisphaera phototrophica]QXD31460.1 Dabb family protein [Candidatus Pelagisphaera phototrophica]